MRCCVCDNTEWENIDHLRVKPHGMGMCTKCGFVSYKDKYKTEEEIKEYYRKEYRPAPNVQNLFTGERKLHYHHYLLSPLFEEWKKAGITKPVIGEIGSAYGLFLHWIKTFCFPEAEVYGTELTESYRRVCWHEFEIKLEEDLDYTKKYDLICSYHVLEHQLDPDKALKKYADCLSDQGVFYLSTPVWFREALNFGASGFDIEYYWHPDHINAWSEEHLECVIKKAGLEVIHKNDNLYGNTYILKKAKEVSTDFKVEFNRAYYMEAAERIFNCWKALQVNDTAIAIEQYKNCPAAWINHYELHRKEFHENRAELDKFLSDCDKSCPHNSDSLTFIADVLTRYERYDEAQKVFERALERKPNNPSILFGLANSFRMRGMKAKDEKVKIENLKKSVDIMRFVRESSIEMRPQAISWIYQDESQIPITADV